MTHPTGQVRLPVTFGERDNYRTELIDFNVVDIRLPYNTILGYPALAKFMAATHHGYNVLKMPGSGGVITVACQEKDTVCSLERASRLQRSRTLRTRTAPSLLRLPPSRRSCNWDRGLVKEHRSRMLR